VALAGGDDAMHLVAALVQQTEKMAPSCPDTPTSDLFTGPSSDVISPESANGSHHAIDLL
jgi:hypothetical protein